MARADVIFFIEELFLSLKTYDFRQVGTQLRDARVKQSFLSNPEVDFVINAVSQAFGIPREELICGNGRKNYRTIACGFCCYYLRFNYNFSVKDISSGLHWEKTRLFDYMRLVRELDPAHPEHAKFIQIKKVLDKAIASTEKLKSNV